MGNLKSNHLKLSYLNYVKKLLHIFTQNKGTLDGGFSHLCICFLNKRWNLSPSKMICFDWDGQH